MNRKADKFFDAITLLPEDIVEEAQDYRFRKRPAVWRKIGSLAACLALVASISLLALPRGCGAGAPDNGSPPLADGCAPADMPVYSGTEPEAPAGEVEKDPGDDLLGGTRQSQFEAVVIETGDGSILVESVEGEDRAGSRIRVKTAGLELPELAAGDRVRITYSGWIRDTNPAGIDGTTAIERIEEE